MHDASIPHLFLVLAAILVGAKLLGELAERLGQPSVLGELVAGVLLGESLLGVVPSYGPTSDFLHVLAQFGVVLLLFEIGLETDLREMFRVGPASLSVATVGVFLPFALGFFYWAYLHHPASPSETSTTTTAIFVGATLTATSVGITARVLSDLGRMHTAEARIIIGAAVIDDVLGLVILAVVSSLAAGAAVGPISIFQTLGLALGFLVVAVLVGRYAAPRLFDLFVRMRVRYVLLVFAVAFVLSLSAGAQLAGSALIIGSFAAGLILSGINQFDTIVREIRPLASVFAPVFFVVVGASINLRVLDPTQPGTAGTLGVAAVLILVAVVGKFAAGWAAPWLPFRRSVVGVGMVPRGEVGLIFADIGRRTEVLNEAVFGAILLMVMVTTLVTPPGLKLLFGATDTERR